jgi:hypothetical protein
MEEFYNLTLHTGINSLVCCCGVDQCILGRRKKVAPMEARSAQHVDSVKINFFFLDHSTNQAPLFQGPLALGDNCTQFLDSLDMCVDDTFKVLCKRIFQQKLC